jgi:hypothetical protein
MVGKNDKAGGMKSAYELALERMEASGIDRPREESLSDAQRNDIAEARRRAEAKLAELDILHRDKLAKLQDPKALAEQDEYYRREKARIEDERERRLAQIRGGQR